jgi:hypothetical protein
MPFADEGVELIFAKIRNVRKQSGRVIVQGAPGDNPAHVRPQTAILRRVRIAFHISILMVDAVRCHPEKWTTFQCKRGTDGDEILKPFISLESAMREQPMISNANAQAAGDPPQKHRNEKCLPGKHEKRCNGAYVECDHEKSGQFADGFAKRPVPLEKIHECELLGGSFCLLI